MTMSLECILKSIITEQEDMEIINASRVKTLPKNGYDVFF